MTKLKCSKCSKNFVSADALNQHMKVHDEIVSDEDLDYIARQALWEFLNSDGMDKGLLNKAKQANTYRSTKARREQTQSAREATLIMMARELASDKIQFRQFVTLALPDSPMLLGEKTGNA